MVEAVPRHFTLQVERMEGPKHLHGSTSLRLKWSRGVPTCAKKLYMPWNTPAAAEFQVYSMDAVRVDNHKILVPFLEGRAKATWCMAEPHTQAQITQGCPFKEGIIPHLRKTGSI